VSGAWPDWARLTRERDAALAQVGALRATLADIRNAIMLADDSVLTDTLWLVEGETVVDCIDNALQGPGT
jgi:hypothetical protein